MKKILFLIMLLISVSIGAKERPPIDVGLKDSKECVQAEESVKYVDVTEVTKYNIVAETLEAKTQIDKPETESLLYYDRLTALYDYGGQNRQSLNYNYIESYSKKYNGGNKYYTHYTKGREKPKIYSTKAII